jgi:3-deoxy-D-arabino-heptulosonate 7-phosphate (DAHP) synthase class II
MTQPPAQQQQWIVELENLILQHAMGLIQPDVYQQRKQELMRKSQSGSMTTTSLPTQDTDKTYTSHEELLIDYAEGIITAREYEQQKVRFTQKSEPMS